MRWAVLGLAWKAWELTISHAFPSTVWMVAASLTGFCWGMMCARCWAEYDALDDPPDVPPSVTTMLAVATFAVGSPNGHGKTYTEDDIRI